MVNCDSLMGDLFMVKGDDIEERLIDFAVRIIGVCDALPDKPAGRHVRGQLLRSGTSPTPNYAEARSAESPNDFIHKLKIIFVLLQITYCILPIHLHLNHAFSFHILLLQEALLKPAHQKYYLQDTQFRAP